MGCLIAVALALGLALGGVADDGPPRKVDEEYAKVELKGRFGLPRIPGPVVIVNGREYALDLKNLPAGLGEKELKALDGEIVVVQGLLVMNPEEKLLRVLVTKFTPVKKAADQ